MSDSVEMFYFVTDQGHIYKAPAPVDSSHSRIPFPGPDIDQHLSVVASGETLPAYAVSSVSSQGPSQPIVDKPPFPPKELPELDPLPDSWQTSQQSVLGDDDSEQTTRSDAEETEQTASDTASKDPAAADTTSGGLTSSSPTTNTVTGGTGGTGNYNSRTTGSGF